MSAWIVRDKTINRILGFFYWENDSLLRSEIDRKLEDIGFSFRNLTNDKDIDKVLTELGQKMLELNYASVNQRYDKSEKATKFKFEDIRVSKIQALKTLSCFLYQSCEGDCEERELYKVLRDIEKAIALNIIYNLPEYEKAEWG